MKKIALKNAARGTAFDYAGQSWILLENDDGRALCLSKDIIETRAFDEGNCNNFAVASSNKYLNGPYLDNLVDACNGANAFLESELDLTTDDGLKDYGTCTVTIFLLTVDQYRRNRDVIPNADDWWWLSTAFSTKSNGYESLARDVYSDGALDRDDAYDGCYGLRPACYLDSDLLISIEDDEATDDVTPEHAGEIIAALAEQFGGTFATEDQLTTALSFMLGTLRAATLAAAVLLLGGISVAIFTTPTGSKQEANILPPTTTVGAYIPDTTAPAAETVEPTEPAVRYPLTDAERDVVERVVMAEAGGESFEGQMLVAQCILNAAEKRGVEPSEAVVLYSYTKSRPDPTQRVKDAVAAVFDRGETVVDEPILYFYNPALVTSDFHESQIFVIEEGGHRFFTERSTR